MRAGLSLGKPIPRNQTPGDFPALVIFLRVLLRAFVGFEPPSLHSDRVTSSYNTPSYISILLHTY